jgi:hypothetical protein
MRDEMELKAPDEDAMIRAAVADLDDQFDAIDKPVIDAVVRRHMNKRFTHSRIKTYVGIFAERDARSELQKTLPEPAR